MVIFSLFIALLIDRALRNRGHWQLRPIADTWAGQYQRHVAGRDWAQHSVVAVTLWVLPAILLALLVFLQGSTLLTFVINVVVLVVCLGAASKRELIRAYLGHAHRDQAAACTERREALDLMQPELAGHSVGAHIIWLNFRYYFAVAFWFILFGALGALVYALLREFVVNGYHREAPAPEADDDATASVQPELSEDARWFAQALYILEWPAARVAGFAYLLVGHFSRAFPVWLRGLTATQPHAQYLSQVASRAEDGAKDEHELCAEPSAMLTLAKRSMMLLLAATALATLFGWLA